MDNNKLRQIIREEIKKELHEGSKGAVMGYLVGVLIDFFTKKNKTTKFPEKSLDQLESEMRAKLDKRYDTDPKFKKIVDDLISGKDINV